MMYQSVEEKTEVVSITVSLRGKKTENTTYFPAWGGGTVLFCGFLLFASIIPWNLTPPVAWDNCS
jgi:hypothetical protein